jgi:hypothetical protein
MINEPDTKCGQKAEGGESHMNKRRIMRTRAAVAEWLALSLEQPRPASCPDKLLTKYKRTAGMIRYANITLTLNNPFSILKVRHLDGH